MARTNEYDAEVEVTFLVSLRVVADTMNEAIERARAIAAGETSGAVILSNIVVKCEAL